MAKEIIPVDDGRGGHLPPHHAAIRLQGPPPAGVCPPCLRTCLPFLQHTSLVVRVERLRPVEADSLLPGTPRESQVRWIAVLKLTVRRCQRPVAVRTVTAAAKTGVSSRLELGMFAVHHHLIDEDSGPG